MELIFRIIGLLAAAFCVVNGIYFYYFLEYYGWKDEDTQDKFKYCVLFLLLFVTNLIIESWMC